MASRIEKTTYRTNTHIQTHPDACTHFSLKSLSLHFHVIFRHTSVLVDCCLHDMLLPIRAGFTILMRLLIDLSKQTAFEFQESIDDNANETAKKHREKLTFVKETRLCV